MMHYSKINVNLLGYTAGAGTVSASTASARAEVSTYISRRLSVTNDNGQTHEYSDTQFCKLNKILVIIGEPGSGKSALSKAMNVEFGGKEVFAEVIARDQPTINLDKGQLLIIDGLDEVQNDSSGITIQDLLSSLQKADIKQFVLTCRAADWAHVSNIEYMNRRFESTPVVGRLLPLNDDEIEQFIKSNYQSISCNDFLDVAEEHDAIELLRNPQALTLLLNVFQKSGWPATKTDLYEKACINHAKDQNPVYKTLAPSRISDEKTMDAAGFIFAQLLLSGLRTVQLDGTAVSGAANSANLDSEKVPQTHIKKALSSCLFRVSSNQTLEPTHRTIAEFLGAKWIISNLKKNLSIRRFYTLIYGANHVVPTSLRGLHAWIATLDKSQVNCWLQHDPYGCLRYGDVSQLTEQQVVSLLNNLKSLADRDPYFRNEDWDAKFGQGLARKGLQKEILSILSDPDTPYHLSTVVLEAISGSPLANELHDELINILMDGTYRDRQRNTALSVVIKTGKQKDWPNIVGLLRAKKNLASLGLVIEIIRHDIVNFSGIEIADTFIEHEKLRNSGEVDFPRVDCHILSLMSVNQLKEALNVFARELSSNQAFSDLSNKIEAHLLEMLQYYIKKEKPSAPQLWQWIRDIRNPSYHHRKWDEFSTPFFLEHDDLRQQVQHLAIQPSKDRKSNIFLPYRTRSISNGLSLSENDFIYHLELLANQNDKLSNWVEIWSYLVFCASKRDDFGEKTMNLARLQAESIPVLLPKLNEIVNPSIPEWEIDDKRRLKKQSNKNQAETASRHKSYDAIKTSIQNGKHLGAIESIATAYLGRCGELNTAENGKPLLRVGRLVGSNNVTAARDGIVNACEQQKIPTAKEVAQNHSEGLRYRMESICVARCALSIELGEGLNQLDRAVITCALAGGSWGASFSGDETTAPTLEKVESLIFSNKEDKETFVRDTIEIFLENGDEHVSGLYQLTHNERFSDIAGDIAYEWLDKFDGMSTQSLSMLLNVAIILSPPDKLIKLVRKKLSKSQVHAHKNCWLSTAFVICFDEFSVQIQDFIKKDKGILWNIRDRRSPYKNGSELIALLSAKQFGFIVSNFALSWPKVERTGTSWGDHLPPDATMYINECLTKIGTDPSDEASSVLIDLVKDSKLGDYNRFAKHLLAQQDRGRAEQTLTKISLSDVRSTLLSNNPSSIDDLQSLVMDELEYLQKRLQDGQTNGVVPYWNTDTPQDENYCRDRIVERLEERLGRYGIRAHTEGTMPDNRRCDILCTFNDWDLPIEIKGQWHKEVWNAACDQLEDNYSRAYKAQGRGVYLVLWFGKISRKNPPRLKGKALPESADEMLKLIGKLSPRQIAEQTKLFVLDVTK